MAGKFDRSIFIVKFKEETDERLVNLNKGLLSLEARPDDEEVINDILREAHTLKGSAKMVGLSSINQIAHKMEDILSRIKEKKLAVQRQIIDVLLESVGYISQLLDATIKREESTVDVQAACEKLERSLRGDFSPVEVVVKEEQIQEQEEATEKVIETMIEKRPEPAPLRPTHPISPETRVRETTEKPILVEETLRVGIGRLDELMGLIGGMVINKAGIRRVFYEIKEIEDLVHSAEFPLEEIRNKISDNGLAKTIERVENIQQKMRGKIEKLLLRYDELASQLEGITNDLEYMVIKMRMLPVSTLFDLFPVLIRNLAREINKEAIVELKGQETGLDKKILEEIKEPLIHIIRNCIDHGIEDSSVRVAAGKPAAGKITLSAFQEGDYVNIVVEDDGAGIDIEKIKTVAVKKKLISPAEAEEMSDKKAMYLIFTSGFSTKAGITDISGRGVGMDVVKDHIENLKGTVTLHTEKGKGTKVSLRMPLTLATTQALIVKSANEIMAIPTGVIEEIVRIASPDIKLVGEREVMVLKKKLIPILRLSQVLGLKTGSEISGEGSNIVMVINLIGQRVGFLVDELISEEEIVVKGLGEYLQNTKHVSGATILGGGEVAIILNPIDLMASSKGFTFEMLHKDLKQVQAKSILVVDDSYPTRELERNILESCNYEVETAVNGLDALEKLRQRRFDLIITDVKMPKMDGFELTGTIKKDDAYKDIPVIILTSLGREEERKRGIEVKADAYLIKTAFDQTTLLETIDRLIK